MQTVFAGTTTEKNIDNLMVVLRESEGANKSDSVLVSTGPAKAVLADGKQVELSFAWFEFIGDMHIRFVFDGPTSMQNLSADEFKALKLTPSEAGLPRVQ
jgi:hypothetical protein